MQLFRGTDGTQTTYPLVSPQEFKLFYQTNNFLYIQSYLASFYQKIRYVWKYLKLYSVTIGQFQLQ